MGAQKKRIRPDIQEPQGLHRNNKYLAEWLLDFHKLFRKRVNRELYSELYLNYKELCKTLFECEEEAKRLDAIGFYIDLEEDETEEE